MSSKKLISAHIGLIAAAIIAIGYRLVFVAEWMAKHELESASKNERRRP